MPRFASLRASFVALPCLLAMACGSGGTSAALDPGSAEEAELIGAPTPDARRSLEGYACPESENGKAKVLFLDADSTVRVSKAGSVTATHPRDVDILPFVGKVIREYRRRGYLVAIISNQGGVASGKTTLETANDAIHFTAEQLTRIGARVDYWDFAEAKDENRKPDTGMGDKLEAALEEKCGLAVDRDESKMIGDSGYKKGKDGPHPDGRPADDFSNSDRGFAENFGLPFEEPTDAFGWRRYGVFNLLGEQQLLDFYAILESAAVEAREGGDNLEAYWLEYEVRRGRVINEIDAPAPDES